MNKELEDALRAALKPFIRRYVKHQDVVDAALAALCTCPPGLLVESCITHGPSKAELIRQRDNAKRELKATGRGAESPDDKALRMKEQAEAWQ